MDASDSSEFTRRLVGLGELFDASLSPVKQALYFEALQDLPLEAVRDALNDAAKACKFFPKPAEIRELAVGHVDDEGAEAWIEFREAMRTLGAYSSPTFDAAVVGSITDTFGTWPAACHAELSPEMWASKRKEFLQAFRRRQRTETPLTCKRLSGVFEIERGFPASREVTQAEIDRMLLRG